jgi:hypothetical protein
MESLLIRPVWGSVRLWAHKALGSASPGGFIHGLAEVLVVLT